MAILTETVFSNKAESRTAGRVVKSAKDDIIVFGVPGIQDFKASLYTGASEAGTYPTLTVNNGGDAYTSESTTIAYDGATADSRPIGGYYVLSTSGEILFVYADSGADDVAGNLTVRRGCLGTTASATGLANNDVLYVLCSITLSANTTGIVNFSYYELPSDPGVDYY